MMPTCTSPSKLSSPYQAVVTLLLIENSSSMSTVWTLLRDRYLPNVLRKIETHSTFYIETSSLSQSLTIPPPPLKIYQGNVEGLNFEHGPRNKLGVEKIHNSIDLLISIATRTPLVALHLVIVAASTPPTSSDHVSRSSWLRISERMAQEDINCHLVLKGEEDMWPLRVLFEETLRLRSRYEASPPLSINPAEAIVRLTETQVSHPTVHTRPSLRRNSTYPLDSGAAKPCDGYDGTSSQSQSELPSLVTQLQQRHGLTKKKVYGLKPPRMPFFRERDDPPLDPYRKAALPFPAALTDLSLSSPITLTPGGRCAPLSRLDRAARLSRRSPTDTSSRHWHQNQPASPLSSPLSSPENEATSSSNAAKAMHGTANYELPIVTPALPVTETTYRPFPQADQPFAYSHNMYDPDVDSYNAQSGYYPVSYTSSSPNVYNKHTTSRDSSPASRAPLNGTSTTTINSVVSSQSHRDPINMSPQASSSSSSTSTTNSKDDEPFTFDPEYIAATAAMFRQEVLPAYPEYTEQLSSNSIISKATATAAAADPSTSYPLGLGMGSGDGTSSSSTLPYLSPNKAGQLYAMKYNVMTRSHHHHHHHHHFQQQRQLGMETNNVGLPSVSSTMTMTLEYPQPLHSHLPTYSSGSSSLTGWAG
ncbi:hypothetical protein F5887DRAFT_256944 [Amanita rubescens]|nr:hypothetical protein F5887DRAFT_256944 [Amanita rubescens]